jgi:hypothetical protein
VAAVEKAGVASKMSHISTGGELSLVLAFCGMPLVAKDWGSLLTAGRLPVSCALGGQPLP